MNRISTLTAIGHGRTTRISVEIALGIIIILLLVCANPMQIWAQTKIGDPPKPATYFLSSPRAMAMGGCAANLAFYQSSLQNPATLGVFHLDRAFSASFSRSGDRYPTPSNSISLESSTVSIGASPKSLYTQSNDKLRVTIAIAYAKPLMEVEFIDYDLGNFEDLVTNPALWWKESDKTIAIGGCVEYIVRLGLGRRFAEQLDATGVLLELPLSTDLPRFSRSTQSGSSPYRLEITPSLAYVRLDDRRSETIGFSLYGGLRQDINELGSFRISHERENFLPVDVRRFGGEIGVLGMLFLRAGTYDTYGWLSDRTTYGFGFSLHGLMTWLSRWGVINPSSDPLEYLVEHLDITVDYSWHSWNSDTVEFDNTNSFGVGISL